MGMTVSLAKTSHMAGEKEGRKREEGQLLILVGGKQSKKKDMKKKRESDYKKNLGKSSCVVRTV